MQSHTTCSIKLKYIPLSNTCFLIRTKSEFREEAENDYFFLFFHIYAIDSYIDVHAFAQNKK